MKSVEYIPTTDEELMDKYLKELDGTKKAIRENVFTASPSSDERMQKWSIANRMLTEQLIKKNILSGEVFYEIDNLGIECMRQGGYIQYLKEKHRKSALSIKASETTINTNKIMLFISIGSFVCALICTFITCNHH
jgi:hypothetical protein